MTFQQLVDFAPWTFIAQICNLLIQAYLFKRFLFKPVKAIIEKRQAEINQTYDKAKLAEDSANSAKAEYEKHLIEAKEEAAGIVKSASDHATLLGEEIVNTARKEASQLREKASSDIEYEKKKAEVELKNEISGLAVSIASKVVEKEIRQKDHDKLIDDFIREVGEGV